MRYLFVLAFVCLAGIASAQHSITLEAGQAIPAGQLGVKSGKSAGFAEPAIGYGLDYRYQLGDQLGVAVSSSYQQFDQAKTPIGRSLDDQSFFVSGARSHKAYGGFVGPSYQLGDQKSGATLAFMVGYMGLEFGGYSGSYFPRGSDREIFIEKPGQTVSGLAYKTRLGYHYRFTDWLGVSLSANLAYLPTDFSVTRTAETLVGRVLDRERQPGPDLLIFRPALGLSFEL